MEKDLKYKKLQRPEDEEREAEIFKAMTLFAPTSKGLTKQYPELQKIKPIADLTDSEADFCWIYTIGLHANRDNAREKIVDAIMLSGLKLTTKELADWTSERGLPEKIRDGIEAFKGFNASFRMIAAQGLDKTFRNYVEIQDQKVEDVCMRVKYDENGQPIMINGVIYKEFDIEDAKKFVQMQALAMSEMKKIIEMKEENYGISSIRFKKEGNKIKPITRIKANLRDDGNY